MERYTLNTLPNGIIRVFDRHTRWDFIYDRAGKRIGGGGCDSPDVDRLVLERLRSIVKVHHGAFDALKWPAPFSRHLFIDVEPAPGDRGYGAGAG